MERRAIAIEGVVQGVGFRPFVYGLASRLGLGGAVRNDAGSVRIEVEGEATQLDRFIAELNAHPPTLARIDQITWRIEPPRGSSRFEIETSRTSETTLLRDVFVCPDVAICDDCLRELFDPRDRRHRYPFINCTNCGPRLTIIRAAPYDRHNTTMAAFAMCPSCRHEYENPADRRFHAQPIACPTCGPRLALLDADGTKLECADPIVTAARALRAGKIVAIKGLGGYHLASDATNAAAVRQLRARKHRDEKPLAVMVADIAATQRIAHLDDRERDLLASPRRPIVLLRRRDDNGIADDVAPGNPHLGIMLPYTPLHHLLLAEMCDAARGAARRDSNLAVVVMTSGNRSDEPIAYEDSDAIARLRGIADLFLVHDRPIHVRCDDSVTRIVAGAESPVRRSRGYAPQPVALPLECPTPLLAVGGQLKSTFALARGRQAFISHHLGDLDHVEAMRAFERDVSLYEQLFAIRPRAIVCDLHPDYASTRYARRRAQRDGLPCIAVQHHHAHIAACMAEHGLSEPVIGVSFDGTGCGTDQTIWGGEFLVGDYLAFNRAVHLRAVRMPGGDAAVREPWRMALSHLLDAGIDPSILADRIDPSSMRIVQRMLDREINSPRTSSAGRLFDAVAAIAAVRDRVSFEGQAAMELEWLASRHVDARGGPSLVLRAAADDVRHIDLNDIGSDGSYPFAIDVDRADAANDTTNDTVAIDTRPLIAAVARDAACGEPAPIIARRFHSTIADIIVAACLRIRGRTNLDTVVLSGGVFLNALLTRAATDRLQAAGLRTYRHEIVPPNDGGLSLGQAAIAAARLGAIAANSKE